MLKNRYEIMALVEAVNCNPNGDPDMDNRPRVDLETGRGIITDVSFKARIRRVVEELKGEKEGYCILFKDGANLNREIFDAALKANGKTEITAEERKKGNKKVKETTKAIVEKYWDARTFGAVLSTGINGGQVRGPVQVAMSTSVDPIDIEDITITRNSYTADDKGCTKLEDYDKIDESMPDDKKRTMGNKKYIPYGLYVFKATVSANLANKVDFSEEDLEVLIEAITQMYANDVSASKMGMAVLSPVIIFKHVGTQNENNSENNAKEALLGCAPAYKLFDLLEIKKKDEVDVARSYKDYEAVFHISKMPSGVQVGFKNGPFQEISWDKYDDEWLKMD